MDGYKCLWADTTCQKQKHCEKNYSILEATQNSYGMLEKISMKPSLFEKEREDFLVDRFMREFSTLVDRVAP